MFRLYQSTLDRFFVKGNTYSKAFFKLSVERILQTEECTLYDILGFKHNKVINILKKYNKMVSLSDSLTSNDVNVFYIICICHTIIGNGE